MLTDPAFHLPTHLTIPNKPVVARLEVLRARLAATQDDPDTVAALRSEIEELREKAVFKVTVIDPYEPFLYLGVWLTAAL